MRCTIWKRKEDGTYDGVFCHHGDNVGKLLLEKYKSESDVDKIIALGHLSRLGDHLDPRSTTHSFQNPEPGCTVAYSRDKGELRRMFRGYTEAQAKKCCQLYDGKIYCWQPRTKTWHGGLSWKGPLLTSFFRGFKQ
jgi:hypothetical protein